MAYGERVIGQEVCVCWVGRHRCLHQILSVNLELYSGDRGGAEVFKDVDFEEDYENIRNAVFSGWEERGRCERVLSMSVLGDKSLSHLPCLLNTKTLGLSERQSDRMGRDLALSLAEHVTPSPTYPPTFHPFIFCPCPSTHVSSIHPSHVHVHPRIHLPTHSPSIHLLSIHPPTHLSSIHLLTYVFSLAMLIPQPGSNPCSLWWKHGVLTLDCQGVSHHAPVFYPPTHLSSPSVRPSSQPATHLSLAALVKCPHSL